MKISELKQGTVESVRGEIVEKGEPREVTSKYGKRMIVASLKLKDDTGEIKLSLWGDDIEKVKVGDKIEIKNGWVSTFRDELQLSLGRNGEMIVEK
ncbi:DNA-binding protein [Candidatus Micrarchaeota archaeon]|nr:DNA-binding protein [Candidatus Micrarchaeota archaeon]